MAAANNPALRRYVENLPGPQLDKVSEIVLSQVSCDTGCELRLSDVAARLGVELSSVSRKVHKLETVGLVGRSSDPGDGRACRLRITEEGAAALGQIRQARQAFMERATEDWSPADKQRLTELLLRFVTDIERTSGELRER